LETFVQTFISKGLALIDEFNERLPLPPWYLHLHFSSAPKLTVGMLLSLFTFIASLPSDL
jgi:hypothetical protein